MKGINLLFSDKLSIDQFLSILSMTINNHKNFSDPLTIDYQYQLIY